ncbi:MAG: putative membrane protein [Roseivirga sp.]|jgi:putative membrane protein
MTETSLNQKKSLLWIRVLSIAVPLLVAVLISLPQKLDLGDWVYTLPHVIGGINTLTSLCLIIAIVAIKSKNIKVHKAFNTTALVLGALFLLCYVTYHASAPSTAFGGEGSIKYVYYFLLISHILLSIGVVPLVLLAFFYAWSGRFEKHKKMVRFTFPIWLYVSVTGVIVYLMISPYYTF